jgi:hypothetical protein
MQGELAPHSFMAAISQEQASRSTSKRRAQAASHLYKGESGGSFNTPDMLCCWVMS